MSQEVLVLERVIIIGGGATGAGIARDLALRGLNVILLERGDLASGATGRCHALLHSGGRYVVKDPESARECASENEILRRIAPHIIEDTGGLFVSLPHDPDDYPDKFAECAKRIGVKLRELDVSDAYSIEPMLRKGIKRAFWVNDAVIDPFRLVILNVLDAVRHGAEVRTYTEVIGFLREGNHVIGVKVYDRIHGQTYVIKADFTVIAAGAWSGILAEKAGAKVPVTADKGTLLVIPYRIFNTVINRLRPPSDGDIIVPHQLANIIGTTSIPVNDPDMAFPSRDEVARMMNAAVELSPAFASVRVIRAYAGCRPLAGEGAHGREASRTFTIIDHEKEGEIWSLMTIVGGKLTTYRLMAERLSEMLISKLGIRSPCATHKEPLPGADGINVEELIKKYKVPSLVARNIMRRWGSLAIDIVNSARAPLDYAVTCACELVSRAEVRYAVRNFFVRKPVDLIRRVGVCMGPCQGLSCILPLLSEYVKEKPDIDVLDELRELVKERWKGSAPVLKAAQLRQWLLTYTLFYSAFRRRTE